MSRRFDPHPACAEPMQHSSNLVVGSMRRSPVEVHPNFSEAPHSRSSTPHPKTDLSKNQIASRRIIPCPNRHVIFRNKICHSDDFGLWNSVVQQTFFQEKCYIYLRTRRMSHNSASKPLYFEPRVVPDTWYLVYKKRDKSYVYPSFFFFFNENSTQGRRGTTRVIDGMIQT